MMIIVMFRSLGREKDEHYYYYYYYYYYGGDVFDHVGFFSVGLYVCLVGRYHWIKVSEESS